MAGLARSVDLHQAFLWTCDDCGRDNFERAITVDPESIHPDDLAEAREAFGDGIFLKAPTRVTCEHCGARFAACDGD